VAGIILTLTFDIAWTIAAKCALVTPSNAATASLLLYALRTTTQLSIGCVNAPAASQPNTTYGFYYLVEG
jgi:hypothetical protein